MGANFNLLDTAVGDRVLNAAAIAAIMAAGSSAIALAAAVPSVTPPTTRLFDSELTLSGASVAVNPSNGSIVGVKGGVVTAAHLTAGYFYGAEGKVTASGNVDIGSGYLVGAIGQLNVGGATLTSGHIAAVIANIQNPITSSLLNGIYVESSGPGVINSVLQSIANSAFVLDLAPDSGTSACINLSGTAGATATKGWLKIQVNDGSGAVTRYIPLTDSVT